MNSIIDLYSPDGEHVPYRKFSARLAEFLQRYKPDDGWRVSTEFMDELALRPGLATCYEAALRAGHKPLDLGLPPIGTTLICRAALLDKDGNVVATGTAGDPAPFLEERAKALESLETAAKQRLVASLGFAGDVLDRDEAGDQARQGLKPLEASAATGPAQQAESSAITPIVDEARGDGVPTAEAGANEKARKGPVTPAFAGGATEPVSASESSDVAGDRRADRETVVDETEQGRNPAGLSAPLNGEQHLVALQQQIARLAAAKGIEPRETATIEAARAEMRRIVKSQAAGTAAQ